MKKLKQHKSVFYHNLYAVYRDKICDQLDPKFPVIVFIRHEIRPENAYRIFISFLLSFESCDF